MNPERNPSLCAYTAEQCARCLARCSWTRAVCRFFTCRRSPIISHQNTVVNPLEQKSSFALELVACRSVRTPFAVLHRQTLGMLKFVRHGTFAAFASAPVNGRATPLGAHKLHRNNPPKCTQTLKSALKRYPTATSAVSARRARNVSPVCSL